MRLVLLASNRNIFGHYVSSIYQPIHFCVFPPFSLTAISLAVCSFSRPHWKQSHSSAKHPTLPGEQMSLHKCYIQVCFATGRMVGNFNFVPPTHTNAYTHTIFGLIWFGIRDPQMLELWCTIQPQMSQLSCDNSGESKHRLSLQPSASQQQLRQS